MADEITVITDVTHEEWYTALVEDCRAIITEAVFNSRWALVEGYHQLGERIVTDNNFDRKEFMDKRLCNALHNLSGNQSVHYITLFRYTRNGLIKT